MKLKEIIENIEVIDTSKSKGGRGVKSISIVNSDNGKRVALSGKLLEELDNPKTLQFAGDASTNTLYIAEELGGTGKNQTISYRKKGVIYNSALVQKITDMFNIDFAEKTSVTYNNIEIDTDDETGMKYAMVIIE